MKQSKTKPYKKVKNKWRNDAMIKVRTFLEVTENPKGSFSNKEKLINIKIFKSTFSTSCSFELSMQGKKKALAFIKRELYL